MAHGGLAQDQAHASSPFRSEMDGLRGPSERDDGQMSPTANERHFDLHRPCPTVCRVHRLSLLNTPSALTWAGFARSRGVEPG